MKFLYLTVLLWLCGCASYTEQTKEVRQLYRQSSYAEALKKLDDLEISKQSRNRLLFRLEKAMILDRLGEREKSRKLLLEADKIADDLYTESVSKVALSFIYNDSATDYAGEDFEVIAIHTQLALSFLEDDDYKSARVQAKKINNKLSEINNRYEDNKNRYQQDAFAMYLAGIIYEQRKEWDDAIIDYRKALELYKGNYAPFVFGGMPDQLVVALAKLYKKRSRNQDLKSLEKDHPNLVKKALDSIEGDTGEVIVIHEVGSIVTKVTEEFVIGVGSQIIRFSFPSYRQGLRSGWGTSGIRLKSGRFVTAENVQDLSQIARYTLEDRRLRMVAKQTARLLAKGQLTEQARQNFGPLGEFAMNIYSAVSETGDTRSWTSLPAGYFITRATLSTGTHKIQIKTNGVVSEYKTVHVKKGEKLVLRDFLR